MIKRIGRIALVLVVPLVLGLLALLMWSWSTPSGCVAGDDPAVTLANANAGSEVYSDWCHEYNGNHLHVVEAGEGDVVLFIHGFPTIWYSMIRPMEHLRGEYRVVAIDGLGAGLSDAPNDVSQYKLAAMADHLDTLIDALGAERVHLVGHDWGAAFAGAYAQSRPEQFASVTIMSAPPQNIAVQMLETSEQQRQISQYVERLKSSSVVLAWISGAGQRLASGPQNHYQAGRMSEEEALVLQNATSDLRRIDRHINWYRANLPAPDEIAETDFWPSRSATLDVPALLIWGEDDTVFDPSFIELVERSSSNLEVLRLSSIGHAPQWEASAAVNEAIARHVVNAPLD